MSMTWGLQMRLSVIFIWLIALSGCSTTMTAHMQKEVSDLQKQAVEKFGVNHGYDTSVLVGAKSVWTGKTCLDLFTKKVDFGPENTRISLQRGSIETATRSALKSCGSLVKGDCIPIMINRECVLEDEAQKTATEAFHQSQAFPSRFSEIERKKAKEKCIRLGFETGTEDFGQCVDTISK